MSETSPSAPVWRFVAIEDYPEQGILKGDIITARAGAPTRITRRMPINTGLLLYLLMDDKIASVDEFIGPEAEIVAAMERADAAVDPMEIILRVVR